MTGHGNCDLCEEYSTLHEGVCAACAARYQNVEELIRKLITADRMLTVLSGHIGAARGITISELVNEMLKHRHLDARERSTLERNSRELIVQLRLAGHHVCSHPSSGYYMAATPEELDAACNFLYDRAMTSLSQVAAMRRVSLPDLRGQLQLPT